MRMLTRRLYPFGQPADAEMILRTYMENGTDVAELEAAVAERDKETR